MLQKALQTSFKQITDYLSREIRDLSRRATTLEHNTDELFTRTTHLELDLEAAMAENNAQADRVKDGESLMQVQPRYPRSP